MDGTVFSVCIELKLEFIFTTKNLLICKTVDVNVRGDFTHFIIMVPFGVCIAFSFRGCNVYGFECYTGIR